MGRSAGGWLLRATRTIAVEGAPARAGSETSAVSARAEWVRLAAACVLGAGIALSGFNPLNNIAGVLHPERTPALVLLTPPMLLAACALIASWLAPATERRPIPPLAIAAVSGLILGAGLSLLQSDRPDTSLAAGIDDLLAPGLLFFGLRRTSLSLEVIGGSFLAALTVALLRADFVFLSQNGLPTAHGLFEAKFSSKPYDFHYYTLGNPDHTGAFLLMPLALSLFWAMAPNLRRRSRVLLLTCAAVCFATLVLTYSRFGLLVAIAMICAAILVARWAWRYRIAALIPVLALVGLALKSKAGAYVTQVFSTASTSSGGVRIHSISLGFHAIIDHPLTGVGLSRYGLGRGTVVAHSSLVEAGTEMGIFGLLGLLLLIVAFCLLFRETLRREGVRTFAGGAAVAGLAYQLTALLTGNVDVGLIDGFVGIYGLTLALVAVIALRGGTETVVIPFPARLLVATNDSVAAVGRGVHGLGRAIYVALGRAIGRQGQLVAYGIGVSAIVTASIASHIPAVTMLVSRQREVHDALAVIRSGGPPLLGVTSGGYYPIDGAGHGTALYLPLLGQIFHQSNPNILMAWLFLGAFAVTLAIYPLVFDALFGSGLLAVFAPLLLAWRLSFIHYSDTYWVYAWALATALPLLLLAHRRRGTRSATLLLLGTMAFASFANSLRAHSGLPIVLSGVVVLVLAGGSVRKRGLILVVCLLAYLSVSPGAFSVIGTIRDHEIHGSATYQGKLIADPGGSGDAFWQGAYTGLAFRQNRYRIDRFNNSSAIAYVRSVKPNAHYRSSVYNGALRGRFFHLLGSDPGFVVGAEAEKGLLVAYDGLSSNWTLLLLLPILLAGRWRRAVIRDLMIVIPAALVLFVGAVLSWPAQSRLAGYEFGWLGAAAFIWILAVFWTAVVLVEAFGRWRSVNAMQGDRTSPIGDAQRVLLALTGSVKASRQRLLLGSVAMDVGFVVLIAIGIVSGSAQRERFYDAGATNSASLQSPTLPLLSTWSFNHGIPAGFVSAPGAHRHLTSTGTEITTSAGSHNGVLASPRLELDPGRYELVVYGQIADGGLALEAVTRDRTQRVPQAHYWARQTRGGGGALVLRFTRTTTAATYLVLSNWSNGDSSSWRIRDVELRWMPPPSATSWSFAAGLPAAWTSQPGTLVQRRVNGIGVTTSRTVSTYQLVEPAVALEPGTYELTVSGLISRGGMDLGVVDVPTDKWVQQVTASARRGARTIPTVPFTLTAPTVVAIVLANFTHPAATSTWRITGVDLRKLTALRAATGQSH